MNGKMIVNLKADYFVCNVSQVSMKSWVINFRYLDHLLFIINIPDCFLSQLSYFFQFINLFLSFKLPSFFLSLFFQIKVFLYKILFIMLGIHHSFVFIKNFIVQRGVVLFRFSFCDFILRAFIHFSFHVIS